MSFLSLTVKEREIKQRLGSSEPSLSLSVPEPTPIYLPTLPSSARQVIPHNGTSTHFFSSTSVTTRPNIIVPGCWYVVSTSTTAISSIISVPYSQTTTTNFINEGTYFLNSNGTLETWQASYLVKDKNKYPKDKPFKNSIKRALKLLENFGMEKDTKIFLNRDEIEVSHPESLFKFVITRYNYSNLIESTIRPGRSIPFKLELFTKTGLHLANLCVYAEDTPMLDQLFMVAAYVKSGNEEELLRKANFFGRARKSTIEEIIFDLPEYIRPKLLN